MSKRDKNCPYQQVTDKIDSIDGKLLKTKTELEELTKRLIERPDVCPDVEDSEKALKDIFNDLLIEELLNKKPIGDA